MSDEFSDDFDESSDIESQDLASAAELKKLIAEAKKILAALGKAVYPYPKYPYPKKMEELKKEYEDKISELESKIKEYEVKEKAAKAEELAEKEVEKGITPEEKKEEKAKEYAALPMDTLNILSEKIDAISIPALRKSVKAKEAGVKDNSKEIAELEQKIKDFQNCGIGTEDLEKQLETLRSGE